MLKYAALLAILSFSVNAKDIKQWESMLAEADNLFKQGLYTQSLDKYKRVAEETASKYAQFQVAWIYDNGLGVEKNCKEAARWYTFAANSGETTAQNNLFALYSNGCPGVSPNPALAISFLKMAAKSGNSRAQVNLSKAYTQGSGVEKDEFQAYDLARRSAAQNDISGIATLAEYHRSGIGVPVDPQKAFNLLLQAASMKVDDHDRGTQQLAQISLAEIYANGEGVPKSNSSAYEWLLVAVAGPSIGATNIAKNRLQGVEETLSAEEKIAADQKIKSLRGGNSRADAEDLVLALQQAIEDKRESDVVRLAKLLAEQDNPAGQYVLALMYTEGHASISKDIDEAYVLFKRSCASGFWYGCSGQVSLLITMHRIDEAKSLLEKVSKEAPQGDEYKLVLADLLLRLGSLVKAEIAVREVLLNDPINEKAKSLLLEIQKASIK